MRKYKYPWMGPGVCSKCGGILTRKVDQSGDAYYSCSCWYKDFEVDKDD